MIQVKNVNATLLVCLIMTVVMIILSYVWVILAKTTVEDHMAAKMFVSVTPSAKSTIILTMIMKKSVYLKVP